MPHDIYSLSETDTEDILSVINDAAVRYEGVIPNDRYSDPYMSQVELGEERTKMEFFGVRDGDRLVGVIGFQPTDGVTLIRHLYVRPDWQRRGIGSALLEFAIQRSSHERLYVGTWRDAEWAIDFYEANGFTNLGNDVALLERYWDVPLEQRRASVVLTIERP